MKIRIIIAALLLVSLTWARVALLPPSDTTLRKHILKLTSATGLCTGGQIEAPSGKTYVLTAGHCSGLLAPGEKTLAAESEDGTHKTLKVIAEDPSADLLLLEGFPGLPGLPLAKYVFLHEQVRIFSHGKMHATFKTAGELLELETQDIPLVSITSEEELKNCVKPKNRILGTQFGLLCGLHVTQQICTAWTVPGSSGSPALNALGEVVGVTSATDGPFTAVVPLSEIVKFLSKY